MKPYEELVIPEEIRRQIPSDFGRSKGVSWDDVERMVAEKRAKEGPLFGRVRLFRVWLRIKRR